MAVRSTAIPEIRPPQLPPHAVDPFLADLWSKVGLQHRADQIRAVVAKCAGIDTDVSSLTTDLDAAKVRAVYSIVNGTKSTAEAALDLDAARRIAAAAPIVGELAEATRAQLHYDCAKALWTEGDALILELDAVVQSAVAVIVKAAPSIGNVDSDTAAVRVGGAASTAWSLLQVETDRITTAHALARLLRVHEFVPTVREAGVLDWSYREPGAVLPYWRDRHPVLTMLGNIEAGAGPCCATADEIMTAVYGEP